MHDVDGDDGRHHGAQPFDQVGLVLLARVVGVSDEDRHPDSASYGLAEYREQTGQPFRRPRGPDPQGGRGLGEAGGELAESGVEATARRDELGGGDRAGALGADERGQFAQGGVLACREDAAAASEYVQPGLYAGDGDVEEAYAVAGPRGRFGAAGGMGHPEAVAVVVLHGVEDDHRELAALEAVGGADLGELTAAALDVPQRLQGGFRLYGVRRDDAGRHALLTVQVDQGAGEQRSGRPPALAATGEVGPGQALEPVGVDDHHLGVTRLTQRGPTPHLRARRFSTPS
nr:hypothetical protein [Streptomyces hygroscopicus]